MIKNNKTIDKLISELEKNDNVCLAAAKAGISHATLYRWRAEDPELHQRIDDAICIGRENMNSFVESKLIQNVSNNNQRAIEFHMRSNNNRYKQPQLLEYERRYIVQEGAPPIALVQFVGPDLKKYNKDPKPED